MCDGLRYTTGMSKRDWFLFISTFAVAVLCGMWLYFTTFVPEYVANPLVEELTEQTAPAWTLATRLYGGCDRARACAAFEITSRGQYRYQPTPTATVVTGRLPAQLRSRYVQALETPAPTLRAQVVNKTACRSFVDGIDYVYTYTTSDEQYVFDTCRSNLAYEDSLIALTNETLRYLDNPSSYQPTGGEQTGQRRGLGGYIERRLDEIFDYDER